MFALMSKGLKKNVVIPNPNLHYYTLSIEEMQDILLSLYEEQFELAFYVYLYYGDFTKKIALQKAKRFAKDYVNSFVITEANPSTFLDLNIPN